jgi:UDP-GlcNAc:undecaprenyl-phosphate/decaprenyl-phosphate GlcNAc-1-phosphate transferase
VALTPWLAPVTAFVVALLAVLPLTRIAIATGIVDHPGPLKVQTKPVPYLGGAAVMCGLLAASWTRIVDHEVPIEILLPLGLALALGIADDARDLPIGVRVAGELAIGVAVAWAVPSRLGTAGFVLVPLLAVLLMNGVNLLDGLDGLAAGVALASSAGFAVLLTGGGRVEALSCLGAVAGFAVFNRPPARIYLGDGGSYLLGSILALLVVLAWRRGAPPATSAASLLLVALPLAEVAWAVIRRARSHLPLLEGDRGHSYDRLVARGWGAPAAAGLCATTQALLAAVGLGAAHLAVMGAAVVVLVVAVALMAAGAAAGFLSPARSEPRP